ncbi:MAG TPA: glycosyltransferase [Bacteroidales bacterium]|nr:glycosyltransferase [Bacteroidales bacterium]HPT10680.1 glycosyltransferase [Bacteroidales bacterium]
MISLSRLINTDIVITGLQSWNFGLGSNIANMARVLAKNNRVLFVNYALDRTTLWRKGNEYVIGQYRKSKASGKPALEIISDNLFVFTPDIILESINQLGNVRLFDLLNKRNSKKFAESIRKAIRELKFNNYILLSDSDFYRSFLLPDLLKPAAFIYYIRDNMVATDYYRHHGERMEKAFIEKADLVVANSEVLAAYARRYNQYSFDVGQGCDLELYNPDQPYGMPEDLKPVKDQFRICIGYTGALKSIRIDESLLVSLAASQPEYAFVFVGPEDEVFQKSRLHEMRNVFFLGLKPENQLPSYLRFFDVAINPQRINTITNGNYPRKVDEYLAMGLPVVATATETMKIFKDQTYLAVDPGSYTAMIDQALKENCTRLALERQSIARQHTWENNIARIDEALTQVLSRNTLKTK